MSKNETLSSAIDELNSGNITKFQENVKTALMSKISEKIDQKKAELFSEMGSAPPKYRGQGEEDFAKLHTDNVDKHDYPGATGNQFKAKDVKKDKSRKADQHKDGEKKDPTDTGEKLKKHSYVGTRAG